MSKRYQSDGDRDIDTDIDIDIDTDADVTEMANPCHKVEKRKSIRLVSLGGDTQACAPTTVPLDKRPNTP